MSKQLIQQIGNTLHSMVQMSTKSIQQCLFELTVFELSIPNL